MPRSSGFAAGSFVHVREGLRHIETIKVGDVVLSRPEQGGERAYKRVLRRIVRPPTRVVRMTYFRENARADTRYIDTPLDHLFWVAGRGWTETRHLFSGFGENKLLEVMDGTQTIARRVNGVLPTEIENIGWISYFADNTDGLGYEWDFALQKLHRSDVPAMEDIQFDDDPPPLEVPLYNLEVEEVHTYYVGAEGVWVHSG
jgi:hypothetical protein